MLRLNHNKKWAMSNSNYCYFSKFVLEINTFSHTCLRDQINEKPFWTLKQNNFMHEKLMIGYSMPFTLLHTFYVQYYAYVPRY